MTIKITKLPKTGDFIGVEAKVSKNGQNLFSVIRKISGTELASCIAKGCVSSEEEALKKLKEWTSKEANSIKKSQYKQGAKYEDWYSPCW